MARRHFKPNVDLVESVSLGHCHLAQHFASCSVSEIIQCKGGPGSVCSLGDWTNLNQP